MFRGPDIIAKTALLALGLGLATPAWAGTGMSIPEPTTLTLLAIGVAGLIIGRQGSRRPPEE